MIKEKLQQVGHDMRSPVEKQYSYHGHYQTPVSESLPPTLTGISLHMLLGSGHAAVGGHSTNTAAYMNASCLPAPQGKVWEATHVAGEIYTIETFAYDHGNAEAQSYQLS